MRQGYVTVIIIAVAGLMTGCPSPPRTSPASLPAATPRPRLRFMDSGPPNARVFVDGRDVGSLRQLSRSGGAIATGIRRIEIRHPGYVTYRLELRVHPAGERLRVRLKKKRTPTPASGSANDR